MEAAPAARAAWVVSPTYYGMAADIAGLAEVAHAFGMPLVVDQAWGPHFGFHEALPPPALAQGADAMLTSTHKIAGSLTQSAMLHVGLSGRIDPESVARALRLLRTTSPSSLLLASLDGARRQLASTASSYCTRRSRRSRWRGPSSRRSSGIRLVDSSWVGRSGIAGYDPMRIVVDVRGTGCTGYEVADALRRSYDVHVELPTQATIVLIVGLADTAKALRRLAGDIEETVKRIAKSGTTAAIVGPAKMLLGEMAVPPRDAFLGEADVVPVADAVGRSRANRSRATRRACRSCSRASGSRARSSRT